MCQSPTLAAVTAKGVSALCLALVSFWQTSVQHGQAFRSCNEKVRICSCFVVALCSKSEETTMTTMNNTYTINDDDADDADDDDDDDDDYADDDDDDADDDDELTCAVTDEYTQTGLPA
eukprot:61488-Amphidinium_carterae.2